MIMITGGAYQGKTQFAVSEYGCKITDGKCCEIDSVFTAECVKNYHLLVKRLLENGENPVEFTERLCRENPSLIVIMDEIGGGIIPLEKSERIWRETVGKAGCIIAENSEKVIRMICGISHILKGQKQ